MLPNGNNKAKETIALEFIKHISFKLVTVSSKKLAKSQSLKGILNSNFWLFSFKLGKK